jgi:hypothetical protein
MRAFDCNTAAISAHGIVRSVAVHLRGESDLHDAIGVRSSAQRGPCIAAVDDAIRRGWDPDRVVTPRRA